MKNKKTTLHFEGGGKPNKEIHADCKGVLFEAGSVSGSRAQKRGLLAYRSGGRGAWSLGSEALRYGASYYSGSN